MPRVSPCEALSLPLLFALGPNLMAPESVAMAVWMSGRIRGLRLTLGLASGYMLNGLKGNIEGILGAFGCTQVLEHFLRFEMLWSRREQFQHQQAKGEIGGGRLCPPVEVPGVFSWPFIGCNILVFKKKVRQRGGKKQKQNRTKQINPIRVVCVGKIRARKNRGMPALNPGVLMGRAGQPPTVIEVDAPLPDGRPGKMHLVKTKGGNVLQVSHDERGRLFFTDMQGNLFYDSGIKEVGFYFVSRPPGNLPPF